MMMIIIGRDGQTGRLKLTVDGKTASVIGEDGSVPKSVGREHASLSVDQEGQITLRNLKIGNDTYVNGIGVEVKRLKEGDRIELSRDRFPLGWDKITPLLPKFADIRPLKYVWDEYQQELLALQIKERRSNVWRSATGLITMGAMVASIFTSRDNPIFIVLYVIAGIVSAAFFVKAYIDSARVPRQQQEIRDSLPKKYVCPQCGQFLGAQSYEIISQRPACPYCKAIYRK